jgi:hypothetical protein
MKRFLLWVLLLSAAALAASCAGPGYVGVGVRVGTPLPHIVLAGPPDVIVIPGTYVYVVPDLDADLYFYSGWWWYLWEGSWYRSRYYDSGWIRYRSVPSFYRTIPRDWRRYYSGRNWEGYSWNYQRIPERELRSNWKSWSSRRYWEKQKNWWVEGYNPKTRRPHKPQYQQKERDRED